MSNYPTDEEIQRLKMLVVRDHDDGDEDSNYTVLLRLLAQIQDLNQRIEVQNNTLKFLSDRLGDAPLRKVLNDVFYVKHYVGPIQDVRKMIDEVMQLIWKVEPKEG